jgi:hypothetical protein
MAGTGSLWLASRFLSRSAAKVQSDVEPGHRIALAPSTQDADAHAPTPTGTRSSTGTQTPATIFSAARAGDALFRGTFLIRAAGLLSASGPDQTELAPAFDGLGSR